MLKQCKADGWRVTLVYLWLPSPKDAIDRVARRVQRGGHNVPSDVVERRYLAGLSNMLGFISRWRMWPAFTIIRMEAERSLRINERGDL
jgi:predicted ABC-type ATPase